MKTFISYLNENKTESIMKITYNSGYPGDEVWVIPNTRNHGLSYEGHGIPHRVDGPAITYPTGSKFWYINGLLHRKDGPAQEFNNGYISWYLNGEKIKPNNQMMSKYIRLNPENIFKNHDWPWPKEIQALAIELGGEKIKDRLIREKRIHPSLIVKGLDKLDKRGFFN